MVYGDHKKKMAMDGSNLKIKVMSHYFPLFTCLCVPILISDLCLTAYYFLNFTVWAFIYQKFVILFNFDFLSQFYYYFQGSFGILLGLEINSRIEEELTHYQFLFVGPELKIFWPIRFSVED